MNAATIRMSVEFQKQKTFAAIILFVKYTTSLYKSTRFFNISRPITYATNSEWLQDLMYIKIH